MAKSNRFTQGNVGGKSKPWQRVPRMGVSRAGEIAIA
jgi:hypothetical protein